MAGTCRINLLGEFSVGVDFRAIPDSAWRAGSRALVALLALEPTHHLKASQVMDRLWLGASAKDAQHELARAVKDARKVMRDARAITTEGDRLRLWPHGDLMVDAHTFAAKAKHARNTEQRAAALEMYAGDLLPGWPDPGVEPLRARLRLTYLELLRDPASGTPQWIDLREPLPRVLPTA
jgi:DNA-binding SARP family transcriptional activator